MIIKCPKCGESITVEGLGRKKAPITFINVSKALQWHLDGYREGKPHLINTAKEIYTIFGIKVTPGFVLLRLRKEASRRKISYDELSNSLREKGE